MNKLRKFFILASTIFILFSFKIVLASTTEFNLQGIFPWRKVDGLTIIYSVYPPNHHINFDGYLRTIPTYEGWGGVNVSMIAELNGITKTLVDRKWLHFNANTSEYANFSDNSFVTPNTPGYYQFKFTALGDFGNDSNDDKVDIKYSIFKVAEPTLLAYANPSNYTEDNNSSTVYWHLNDMEFSTCVAKDGDNIIASHYSSNEGNSFSFPVSDIRYINIICNNPIGQSISTLVEIGNSSFSVNAYANPPEIFTGSSSNIIYSSVGTDSCKIYLNDVIVADYCLSSGNFNTGTLTNTTPSPTIINYRVECGKGDNFAEQTPTSCSQGVGYNVGDNLSFNETHFNRLKNNIKFTKKISVFSKILSVASAAAEPSGIAYANVLVKPTPPPLPPTVTLTLQPGGNDGKGKDLVDANVTNNTLGISHLVPDIDGIGLDGSCDLLKDNIVDQLSDSPYPNDYHSPIDIKDIPANSGTSYKLKCNNGSIIADLKYPNGSLATVKGQAGTVTPGQNANGGCVNPNQGGAQACCVIQENQSSCNVSVNWSTVNSAKTVQNGNVSYFENGSSSHITDADSGNSLGIGIGTVDSPLSYNLHNEVDGEFANTTSDNLLGTIKLKSECAPGLSNIDGVCKTDASNLPDLIAQNTQAPGNVEGGETFTVTTTIKNQGNKDATQDPIYVLFQATDTDPGQTQGGDTEAYNKKPNLLEKGIAFVFGKDKAEATGIVDEKHSTITGGLLVGDTKNANVTFSFSTVGNRWIRACADKMSSGDSGLVEESSEENNCSSWKKVTVGLPDLLTMNTQAAATVPVNTALSVSTTVKNQGNGDANSTFYVLFQTSTTAPNGGQGGGQEFSWLRKFVASIFGIDKVIAAGSTPPALPNVPGTVQVYGLSAGGSIGKSLSLTFNTVGDKWIRTCADKKSPSDVGLVHESNEGNNCSGWIKVTVVEPAPQNSDLQASTPTPTVAVANKPITFSSTILNAGNESTLVSFYNLFQTKPNPLSSDITDYRTNFMMPAVLAGQSKVAQRAITFTTPGQVYMRACADKSSQADTGLVHNESDEYNNCSDFVKIEIRSTGAPDLTIQRGVIPTSAQVGVSTTFRTTVSNIGALTTGASFPNIFQVSSNASGLGAETFSAGDLSELQAGESVALSTNYTFANEGTYYARFCADLNTRIQGVITEENENNNCGLWTPIAITPSKDGVDLTASNPIPRLITTGVSTLFKSTITNSGNTSTVLNVHGLFQTTEDTSGTILSVTDYPTNQISPIIAGGTGVISANILISKLPKYIRACADKDSASSTGYIIETNENNNCSDWVSLEEQCPNEAVNWPECDEFENECPNGAVNWPECTLNGDGDCINGALNPPQCDEFNNTSGAQCNNSVLHGCLAGVDENHSEGQDYYYWDCRLKDSVAHCFYPKNGGVGTGNGDEGNVTLTAVPSWIFKGRISTLTWSSWSGARCSIMPGEFTGLLDNGSLQMRPSETTTYTANCTDSTNTGQASATVKVINPLIFEQ